MSWTREQVLALAADAASAKSGATLATARGWSALGRDEQAAWGLSQGSGKDPYQARIDFGEPAFRCSCPSRKFPCKHGLALFLLLAEQPALFAAAPRPAWVQEWFDSRRQRGEKKSERVEAEKARAEVPEVRARRAVASARRGEQREERVAAGVADLEQWLRDLVREGLAAAPRIAPAAWERQAARLVDAQAPGLRRLVHQLGATCAGGSGWQDRFLDRLGRLHLLLRAYRKLDSLPPRLQLDVRARIGWTQEREEVLAGPGVRDRFQVLGQVTEEDELDPRMRVQRTWLWGVETGRPAMILQFAVGPQPFEVALMPGTIQELELAYFPGAAPQRALIKDRFSEPEPATVPTGFATIDDALAASATALCADPWLDLAPLPLRNVIPKPASAGFLLCDPVDRALPLGARSGSSWDGGWELVALGGGRPIDVFGEWDGERLRPLSARVDGDIVLLERGMEVPA